MNALPLGTVRFRRTRAMSCRLRPLIESLESRTLLDGQGFNLGELEGQREVLGTLLNAGDLSNDVVSFRLTAPGWVDARCDFAFPNSNGPGALKLLDAKGKQLAADGLTSGVSLSTVVNQSFPILLAPGDYQIQVGRTAELPENEDPGYRLFVVADYAGDDFSNARDGGVLALPQSYTDFVGTLADVRVDVDYYKFAVPTPRRMQATLTVNGDPTFFGFQICVDTDNDGDIESYLTPSNPPGGLDLTVPAGTLYVMVGFGSNGAAPPPSYTLSVSSFDIASPRLTIEPKDIDFGSVPDGSHTTQNVTIKNVGPSGSVLTISSVDLVQGQLEAPFKFIGGAVSPVRLASGESHTFVVAFAPMSGLPGSKLALLRLRSDDPSQLTVDVPISGTVEEAKPVDPQPDGSRCRGRFIVRPTPRLGKTEYEGIVGPMVNPGGRIGIGIVGVKFRLTGRVSAVVQCKCGDARSRDSVVRTSVSVSTPVTIGVGVSHRVIEVLYNRPRSAYNIVMGLIRAQKRYGQFQIALLKASESQLVPNLICRAAGLIENR